MSGYLCQFDKVSLCCMYCVLSVYRDWSIIIFSSFLTISLCRAGHYLSHPVFGLVPCLLSVGISSYFPLCYRYISFSVDLCSASQKLFWYQRFRTDVIVFLLQTVAKPPLIYCFPGVSMGFICASFPMPSFLMWSNLVFPLVHLNILFLAELSLLSRFLTASCFPSISFSIFTLPLSHNISSCLAAPSLLSLTVHGVVVHLSMTFRP